MLPLNFTCSRTDEHPSLARTMLSAQNHPIDMVLKRTYLEMTEHPSRGLADRGACRGDDVGFLDLSGHARLLDMDSVREDTR